MDRSLFRFAFEDSKAIRNIYNKLSINYNEVTPFYRENKVKLVKSGDMDNISKSMDNLSRKLHQSTVLDPYNPKPSSYLPLTSH